MKDVGSSLIGRRVGLGFFAVSAAAAALGVGCRPDSSSVSGFQTGRPAQQEAWRSELFDVAVINLNRLEEFDNPEMLQQIVNRFDQWSKAQPAAPDWKPDPFVHELWQHVTTAVKQARAVAAGFRQLRAAEKLSAPDAELGKFTTAIQPLAAALVSLAELTGLQEFGQLAEQTRYLSDEAKRIAQAAAEGKMAAEELSARVKTLAAKVKAEDLEAIAGRLQQFARRLDLSRRDFDLRDGAAMREAVWLRDVARWAGGPQRDDPLRQAVRLFDWTVRNIQIMPDAARPQGAREFHQAPWETLLMGQGTTLDRARIFLLLARQERIDAALVAVIDPEDPTKQRIRPWAVGVLIDENIYLFDPVLGLPIPGPAGPKRVDSRLDIVPATLAQAAADDSVLEQLNIDAEHPYGLKAASLKEVMILLEAAPEYLAERMRLVESRLAGDDAVVLAISQVEQAARFRKQPHVLDCVPWRAPVEAAFEETFYANDRAQWQLALMAPLLVPTNPLHKGRVAHLKGRFAGEDSAITFYQRARLSERELGAVNIGPEADAIMRLGKLSASYWLGLMAYEQENYKTSIDYFKTRILEAYPDSAWTTAARYNLARSYEALDRIDEAVKLYRTEPGSPGYLGNLLRAKWLDPSKPPLDRAAEALPGPPKRPVADTN